MMYFLAHYVDPKEETCLNCLACAQFTPQREQLCSLWIPLIKIKDESMISKPSIYPGREIAELLDFSCRNTLESLLPVYNLHITLMFKANKIDRTNLVVFKIKANMSI